MATLHTLPMRIYQLMRYGQRSSSPDVVGHAEQTLYRSYLKPNMTVFDIGANIGDLTMLFSQLVQNGQVHAFEACHTTYQRLVERCRLAGRSNVLPNHLAIAEREGTLQLQIYDDYSGWNTVAKRPLRNYGITKAPKRVEDVSSSTIDAYCEHRLIDHIDLLKIDVEGAEYQVLLGAQRMLKEKRVLCCIFEFGSTTYDMGNDPSEIKAYAESLGYRIANIVEGDPIFPGSGSAMTARFSMHMMVPAE